MYQYSSPPPGWSAYDYTTSPSGSHHYSYYVPPAYGTTYGSPRAKRHSYRASYSASKDPGAWYSSPSSGYNAAGYYEGVPDYSSHSRKYDHVSPQYDGYGDHRGTKTKTKTWNAHRRSSIPHQHQHPQPSSYFAYFGASGPGYGSTSWRSQKRSVYPDGVDDAFESPSGFGFVPRATAARPSMYDDARTPFNSYYTSSSRKQKQKRPPTDHYFYFDQVPLYDDGDSPKRSRARRASTSTRTPQKPRPPPAARPTPKATEADAIREGIPSGYSMKNWDPTERPILLLGSVFDANSLGKWIYDWTVFHHGASTPMADVAGDLWLLLIKLAGKVKRADEIAPRIRNSDARELVEDFLESGDRLWIRFKKLLKACEVYMWKAAKRESGGKNGPGGGPTVMMGRNAGCEFVDSIFGRDRELENTEKLMNSIRLWSMRFDVNCEDILRRPSAA